MIQDFKKNYLSNILILLCFFTNLSQLPFIVENGLSSKFAMLLWILVIMVLFLNNKIYVSNIILPQIVCIMIFMIFGITCRLLTGNQYVRSNMANSFFISCMVFFIGFYFSKELNDDDYYKMYLSYIISAIIVSVFVWLKVRGVEDILNSRVYAYTSKNSVSQIILTCIVLLMLIENKKNYFISLFKIIMIMFLILLLILLKSRASMLSIPIIIIMILSSNAVNKKKKFIIKIMVLVIVGLFIIDKSFSNTIINDVILGGRDANNLNDVTSGRSNMWLEFPKLFEENFFIGKGYYYTESFPLAVLLNYGVIGSIPVFVFTLMPLLWSLLKSFKNKDNKILILVIISVIYWFNGLFEELSPIGPGVKCYFLWLIFGLCLGHFTYNKNIKERSNNK